MKAFHVNLIQKSFFRKGTSKMASDSNEYISIDPNKLDPGWKKLIEIRNNQKLIFNVIREGYSKTFSVAFENEKEFLITIKGISKDSKLLRKKMLELQSEAPDIKTLPLIHP